MAATCRAWLPTHNHLAINCPQLTHLRASAANLAQLRTDLFSWLFQVPCTACDTVLVFDALCKAAADLSIGPVLCCVQLVLDVRRLTRVLKDETDSSIDVAQMASRLSAMGYRVTVRVLHSWGTVRY